MRRKWNIVLICIAAVLLISALIVLPNAISRDGSVYSRRVEEALFLLEMESLNCTVEETFYLQKGDTIDVSAADISGELSCYIGRENNTSIYEGRSPMPGAFRVTVPEDGDYIISVTGRNAKGNISFRINDSLTGSGEK